MRFRIRVVIFALTLVGGGLLVGPEAASAQTCIQDVWQAHGNSNSLTCTANDVTLSSASNINISSGGECVNGVCSCFAGQTVTFTADFRMDLTAQARYDVGFYLATDGDITLDGALTGQCSATASLAGNTLNNTFINLDAAPDVCGEITDASPDGFDHNPVFVRATISAPCPSIANQKLRLPFATTWRQTGANDVCTGTGNGTTTNGVYPGAPSKCNKGILELDITSVTTTLTVTKTALTQDVPETGGPATYSVTVKNDSTVIAVTLRSLEDDPYGDITTVAGDVTATTCVPDSDAATCEIGGTIAAGGECSCSFTATVPPGDFGGPNFKDTVEACVDNATNPTLACDDDDAEVPYTDVSAAPTLTKSATSSQCTIDTTYSVVVENNNSLETLTLNSLMDDVYNDITTAAGASCTGNCIVSTTCGKTPGPGVLPFTIAADGNYSCSFVGRTNVCNGTVVDEVTGGTVDEDGKPFTPKDTATVTISVTRP